MRNRLNRFGCFGFWMSQTFLIGGILVAIAPHVCAQDAVVPPKRDDFHLFLLVGQSNMAGRGDVADSDRVVHPKLLSLDQQGEWTVAVDPLHFDKPKAVGVGPGRTFGLRYAAEHPEATVGLIPCAAGGSSISAWKPGGYHDQTDSHPYDDTIRRAKVALRSGVLKGVLWHQGESDSNATAAGAYADKLRELVERLRTDLGSPGVPFIVGQLGQFSERPWSTHRQTVDSAHRSLSRVCDNVAFVSSDGLVHKGDQIHFDAASVRTFGERYYDALKHLDEKRTAGQSSRE